MAKSDKSLDILGIKPLSDAAGTIITASVAGAGAFLSRICLPAAEEFGLLLKDQVSYWRAKNAASIAVKTEKLLADRGQIECQAHPRLIGRIIQDGSWEDDDYMQNFWAGILASSCTQDGRDQSNLIFIDLLSRITASQAKMITYLCENSEKFLSEIGLILAHDLQITQSEALEIMDLDDLQFADIQLDYLREIGMTGPFCGFSDQDQVANIFPSALCLNLYCRVVGGTSDAKTFYGLE